MKRCHSRRKNSSWDGFVRELSKVGLLGKCYSLGPSNYYRKSSRWNQWANKLHHLKYQRYAGKRILDPSKTQAILWIIDLPLSIYLQLHLWSNIEFMFRRHLYSLQLFKLLIWNCHLILLGLGYKELWDQLKISLSVCFLQQARNFCYPYLWWRSYCHIIP